MPAIEEDFVKFHVLLRGAVLLTGNAVENLQT
jgi:hypothetical protein